MTTLNVAVLLLLILQNDMSTILIKLDYVQSGEKNE